MRLKLYQQALARRLELFLDHLAQEANYMAEQQAHDDEMVRLAAMEYDFSEKAWRRSTNANFYPTKDGLRNPLPDIYLKVPTGGGKTLLACHAIGSIQRRYLNRQRGLVLWVMPTNQIYRQTVEKLSDRAHPYRRVIDIASGGRTLIRERLKPIRPEDIRDNLVILMLMLPAANRKTKESLRMFMDAGQYASFFPPDDRYDLHNDLFREIPNLDYFGGQNGLFPRIARSSLGNLIRMYRPLMIVDEGQKAYSPNARETLRGFNPIFMLELSATPPAKTNVLATVSGKDLDREEMIKLDIHLSNTTNAEWKDTLLAAIDKREQLERQAEIFRYHSGRYIRPIVLIQVERTGKDQRESGYLHAEEAREFLIAQNGVRPDYVAIKSSEKDDIEGIDLLSESCSIRYIITKRALQEGWDCSFAYILAILTNPSSRTAMTQLVGRILRQPEARKTGVSLLDECYIFTRFKSAEDIIVTIRKDLSKEGLGDLAKRIVAENDGKPVLYRPAAPAMRRSHKREVNNIYLPQFIMVENDRVRPLNYEADILSAIDWERIYPDNLDAIEVGGNSATRNVRIGLSEDAVERGVGVSAIGIAVDPVFMTRQLVDVVPNAWRAYEISVAIIKALGERCDSDAIANNFIYIVEQIKRILADQRARSAEQAFCRLIDRRELRLALLKGDAGQHLPRRLTMSGSAPARKTGKSLDETLFKDVDSEQHNWRGRDVALYLERQGELLWWYRNKARVCYYIEGWKMPRASTESAAAKSGDNRAIDTVAVFEIQGDHLYGNDDVDHKKSVFQLCNEFCSSLTPRSLDNEQRKWSELINGQNDRKFLFHPVNQREWEKMINGLLNTGARA